MLISYRPTWPQTLGRVALRVGIGMPIVAAMWWAGLSGWAAVGGPVAVVCWAVGSVLLHRSVGIDGDELGLHPTPGPSRIYAPWQRIVDIRAERRRGATVPVVYWDSGAVWRLRAPYDGQGFARDPEFEHKIFTLRNLWETRRAWARVDR